MFQAVVIHQGDSGQTVSVDTLQQADLPKGNVEVQVDYSSLNYKDALAITGSSPIVRTFPMIPGIDLAGTVVTSTHADWSPGDRVLLNGFGVGEKHWGGFAQRACLDGDWLIRVPDTFTTRQSMVIGTAGYTAALCVNALTDFGLRPDQGAVLVTGATGGVGSVAVALLTKAGFTVAASTGKASEATYLKNLGASTIVDRAEFSDKGKPMQKERWAGVVDSVGSHTLANACAQTRYSGAVAACGLAQGMDFPTTVAPFILRGVTLLGTDSVMAPKDKRLQAWERLSRDLDSTALESIAEEIALSETPAAAARLIEGRVRGRIVVDVNR